MDEIPPSLLHQIYPKMMAGGVKEQPRGEDLRTMQEAYRAQMRESSAPAQAPQACGGAPRFPAVLLPRRATERRELHTSGIFRSVADMERHPPCPSYLGSFPLSLASREMRFRLANIMANGGFFTPPIHPSPTRFVRR